MAREEPRSRPEEGEGPFKLSWEGAHSRRQEAQQKSPEAGMCLAIKKMTWDNREGACVTWLVGLSILYRNVANSIPGQGIVSGFQFNIQ